VNTVLHRDKVVFALFAFLFVAAAGAAVYSEMYELTVFPFVLLLIIHGWQYRNGIFFLLLAMLPLSFEYHFAETLSTDVPDEFLMWLVAFLFFAGFLYQRDPRVPASLQHPVIVLFVLLILWTAFAVLFSSHPLLSAKFLLAKGWYAVAFILAPVMVLRDKKRIRLAAGILSGVFSVVLVIIMARHASVDFRFDAINEAVSPFFRNHVNYSAMLVCMIPVMLAFLSGSRSQGQQFLLSGLVILALAALFFSYARGAWLAGITGLLGYWLIRRRILLKIFIAVVIFCIASVFWLKQENRYLQFAHDYQTTIYHKEFGEHLVATYRLKDLSTAERFYRWIAAVRMVKDYPLTGSGPGTFYYHYKSYAAPAFKTWVSDNPEKSTVHNYFLLTLTEQGIPGLVLFLLMLGAILYYIQQLYHRVKDRFYKTAAMVTGVMLVMIITLNGLSDLVETDKIGSLFFLCLVMPVIISINTANDSDPPTDIQRIP